MASRIQEAGYQYKLKCNAALDETKTALCKYVDSVFKSYHQQLLSKCDQNHVSKEHTTYCKYKFKKEKSSNYLTILTNCSVYKKMFDELSLLHGDSDKHVQWSNVRFEDLVDVSNSWEIAKLFILSKHNNSRGPNDIDALTMFRIINTCKLFTPFDFQPLDKLMKLIPEMHWSSSCDKETMTTTLECLVDLLEFDNWGKGGDTSLKSRKECQQAVKQIKQLLDADVIISLSTDLASSEITGVRSMPDGQSDTKPADGRFEKRTMTTAPNEEWYTFFQQQDPATSKPAICNESSGSGTNDLEESINNTVLNNRCKIYGRKSPLVAEVCERISQKLMSCSSVIKSVQASYKPGNEDEIIFVLYTDGEPKCEFQFPPPLNSFPVQCQILQRHCMENKYVMDSKLMTRARFTDDDRDKIKYTLREHSKTLMENHKNLNIISACPIKSRKYSIGLSFQDFENCHDSMEHKVCVVFFVNTKGLIPIEEESLPRELNGFPTDIREGSVELYSPQDADAYHRNIKMGCKMSNECSMYGTLGAFVDVTGHGICCITSAHAVLKQEHMNQLMERKRIHQNDDESLKIYQPDPHTSQLPFGHVLQAAFRKGGFDGETGFEAVLIKVTDPTRCPSTGNFPNCDYEHTGYTASEPMEFMSGKIYAPVDTKLKYATLLKYGSKTGLTRGGFVLQGASIRKSTFNEFENKFGICLHDQIMVIPTGHLPFADHGDSGSLVLAKIGDSKHLQAVGIVSGGAKDNSCVFVTPISSILKAFGPDQQLKQFQSPIDEESVTNDNNNGRLDIRNDLEHLKQRVCGIEKDITILKKDIADGREQQTNQLLEAIKSSRLN